ncbi:ankyrin repeat domain-containing protein [Aquimarina algicola]|uniref:Ankyrin repeat domain-containing protein n=1 Tax=Aquimarina algicola TaxID=2589995 RepID=A0A504J8N7_9FLAO|nr:ankyrin repeat domain-containing protein [Aquimarina algicola]TPN83050.1 ankyrin repeat domain-containing protein [Aquimarina algicola]
MKKQVLIALMMVCSIMISNSVEAKTITNDYNVESVKTKNTVSPFCMAIVKGDLETVKKMIELGSDVNKKSDGMTPVMYASRYNRTEIIKVLVKNGANLKTKTDKGYTALKYAELSNAKEAIELLKTMS